MKHLSTRTLTLVAFAAAALFAAAAAVAGASGVGPFGPSQPTVMYPAAHVSLVPFNLRTLERPATAADRTAAGRSAVTRSMSILLAAGEGAPAEFVPGLARAADVRAAFDGIAGGRTLYLLRTSKGRVCAGLTGFSSGCLEGLPDAVPVTVISADPDSTGTGEAPLVWGVAKDTVTRVDVVVNGTPFAAALKNNAYFFQLPDASMPDRAIETVVAHLSDGTSVRQTVDHGPTTMPPVLRIGPPEVAPR